MNLLTSALPKLSQYCILSNKPTLFCTESELGKNDECYIC